MYSNGFDVSRSRPCCHDHTLLSSSSWSNLDAQAFLWTLPSNTTYHLPNPVVPLGRHSRSTRICTLFPKSTSSTRRGAGERNKNRGRSSVQARNRLDPTPVFSLLIRRREKRHRRQKRPRARHAVPALGRVQAWAFRPEPDRTAASHLRLYAFFLILIFFSSFIAALRAAAGILSLVF